MSDIAARKGKKDAYANKAYGTVTCSAPNTLTFSAIQLAVGLFQGIAMLLHRVQWMPDTTSIREMVAATDSLYLALTSSNRLTSITTVSEPAIIDQKRYVGIGAAVANVELPWVSDFTNLPGGGKLIAANPLYVGIFTGGAVAASTASVILDFTFVELSDRDYLELIQQQFPANL